MAPITKAAQFKMCPVCGKHGNILFPNGNEAASFSKNMARFMASQARAGDLIQEKEMPAILEQIAGSPLPEQAAFIVISPPPCLSMQGDDPAALVLVLKRPEEGEQPSTRYVHPGPRKLQ